MSLKKVIAVIMSSNNRGNDPLRRYLALLEKESKLFNRHLICESKKKGYQVQKAIRNIIQKGAQEKADYKELFINALRLNQGKLSNKRVLGTHLTTQKISKGSDQLRMNKYSNKELKTLANNDKEWQYMLGQIHYRNGKIRNALSCYLNAAKKNYPDAQFELGVMFANGVGVEKNEKNAFSWMRKAAVNGHTTAQYNLGVMLYNGLGVDKDEEEALSWTEKAANQGDAEAQFQLGLIFFEGYFVEKNVIKAADWFKKSAYQGTSKAQLMLGSMLETGQGLELDERQAFLLFEKVAEKNYPEAYFKLGSMLETGRGVGQDKKAAVKWYKKAAEQGYVKAQLSLDRMLQRGLSLD